jgi:hypothetical protein
MGPQYKSQKLSTKSQKILHCRTEPACFEFAEGPKSPYALQIYRRPKLSLRQAQADSFGRGNRLFIQISGSSFLLSQFLIKIVSRETIAKRFTTPRLCFYQNLHKSNVILFTDFEMKY